MNAVALTSPTACVIKRRMEKKTALEWLTTTLNAMYVSSQFSLPSLEETRPNLCINMDACSGADKPNCLCDEGRMEKKTAIEWLYTYIRVYSYIYIFF